MKESLCKELWRAPDILGFSVHWVWIWCVFWSTIFYNENPSVSMDIIQGLQLEFLVLEPLWVLSLASNVLTMVVLLVVSYFRNPLSAIKGMPQGAAVVTVIGTVAISHETLIAAGSYALGVYLAGSALTGIGSAMIVVLWAELFASLGAKKTVLYSVSALLLGSVMYLIIHLLPLVVAQTVVAGLPIVGVVCFFRFRSSVPLLLRSDNIQRVVEKPPYRMIVIAVFFGISFGAMKGLIAPAESEWIAARDLLNIVAIVGGSVAIYVTTSIFKMDFDHLTYQVALPLMAAGFLFLPLHEPWNILGTAVHQFGYQYFYIVLWALWSVLVMRPNVPAGWIVSWGMLSIQFGQFVGSIAAAFSLRLISSDLGLAMLSASIIFIILLISLFSFGKGSANTGWGFVRPIEIEDSSSPFEKAGTRLARRCHLSPREMDVFFLLAKGRNKAYISDELVIGVETVKSHIKSIYRKIDVHSQQELIDLLESEVSLKQKAD